MARTTKLKLSLPGTGSNEAYQFDTLGNRITWSTDPLDSRRLLNDGTYQYLYDDEGNLADKNEIATGKITTYQWDYRNRLVSVTSDSHVIEYLYDAQDKRVGKKLDTSASLSASGVIQERYIYDGEDIALVVDAAGTLVERYLYGDSTDSVLAVERDGTISWSLGDRQGSVVDLVDEDGTVLNHFVYDSFGNRTQTSGVEFRYGYTGRELDTETGLYYYRARYYDPTVGRFISEDPVGFGAGDTNLYRYVGNNATNYTDPTGKLAFLPILGIMALGAAIAGTASVIHQGLEITEGSRTDFSIGEAFGSAAIGFVATPILIVAPELGGLLALKGAVEGFHNMLSGKPLSGAFDVATSIIPFVPSSKAGGIKSPRELTFGESTWFSKFTGGESASWGQRFGRLASEDNLKAWANGTESSSSLDRALSPLREQYPHTKWNIRGKGITEQEAHGLVGKLKDNAISKEQLDQINGIQSNQGYKLTVNLLTEGLAKSTTPLGLMDGGGFYVYEPRILQVIRNSFPRLNPSKTMRIDLHLEALSMKFLDWFKKQPDLQQDILHLPKVEITKEPFDVASNPFKFLGKRVEEIIFFDGKIDHCELEKQAKYVSRFNQPHNKNRRNVAVSPTLKLLLSEKLKIIEISIVGPLTLEMYRQIMLRNYPEGDLPPELTHIKSPIKIRYPVKLPANLTWEMYRDQVQNILGVPNLSKFYWLFTT